MSFEFTLNVESPVSTSNAQTSDRPQVDWAARTKYIVENSGTANKAETEIFIVTGVVDLGMHIPEDGKMVAKDTPEERAEVENNPNEYYETLPDDKGVPTLFKRWKQTKPYQNIAIMVDNPKRLLDIGQFHGNEPGDLNPLRMVLNNEFFQKGVGKIVNKMGYSTKENRNDDGSWSLKNNTTLYKIGKAVGALDEKQRMKPAYIGKLIGKPILCEYQVFTNKVGDKEYLNEKVSFKGEVPSMMKDFIPEIDSKYFFGVNFKGPQDLAVLKNLRESIVNTMKNAVNFEGSDVQKALIELGRVKASDSSQEHQPEQANSKPTAPQETRKVEPSPTPQAEEFEDQELPF